ncbi:MAG TPA: NusG domain II-containing protein [Deltaproteobacteria bacterium]|nr:NusG domain II-containing protein [Deltaproteobacteria bacterium]
MARHEGMRLQSFDLALIAALLFFAGFWWMFGVFDSRDPSQVQIYTAQGLYREVPLRQDGKIRVPGPLGESMVEILSGRVSMVWSPCPNKLCMHAGAVSKSGESIVCIPNRVSVVIRSSPSGPDAVSY